MRKHTKENVLCAKEPEQNIAFRLRPDGNVFWDTEKLQKRIEDNMVRN